MGSEHRPDQTDGAYGYPMTDDQAQPARLLWWCPDCRATGAADEDGCCTTCGADCEERPAARTERDGREAPRVVCLCGSTRFYREYQIANFDLTMAGAIVLSVGFYPHSDEHHEEIGLADAEDAEAKKVELDELHLRKIDLADEVLVICPGGYIGDSTGREIKYAEQTGKPVTYREEFPSLRTHSSEEPTCDDCGAEVWYNAWVEDDVWVRIRPDQDAPEGGGGTLCVRCMDRRCSDAGLPESGVQILYIGESLSTVPVEGSPEEPVGYMAFREFGGVLVPMHGFVTEDIETLRQLVEMQTGFECALHPIGQPLDSGEGER